MTFDIQQRTEEFLSIVKEIDTIAIELQLPTKNIQKSRVVTRLNVISRRLRDLSAQAAAEIAVNIDRYSCMRETLEVSERQFRSLAENLPNNIVRWDCLGNYLYINPTHERTLSRPATEVVGTRIPESHGQVTAAIARVVITGEALPYVRQPVRDEAGNVRIHEVSLIPERDTEGKIVSVLGIGRDVTREAEMEDALAASERQFRTLAENLPNYLARHTTRAEIVYLNPRLEAIYGREINEVAGKTPMYLYPDGRFKEYERAILETARTGIEDQMELRLTTVGDQQCVHHIHLVAERDETGAVTSVLAIGRDITEYKRIEEILAGREREFRTLVEHSPDTIARYDKLFRRVYVNPTFAALVTGGAAALVGKKPSECPGGPHTVFYEKKLGEVFASGTAVEFELNWKQKDGAECCHLIKLAPELGVDGTVERVLAVGRDISELHASREKIHQMAYYDPLTALPNRTLFSERLRQMLAVGFRPGQLAGVLMIDMDRFKDINDTLGHSVGDELLREAAARLCSCVRACDTVARFGGDEFAILLPEMGDLSILEDISKRIISKFGECFVLNGKEAFVSCSIGLAQYPIDSVEADDLMKYADSAMYAAKRSGGRSFRFYSKELTDDTSTYLLLESELRRAIERKELELHYQPKVSFVSNEVVGSEALLRWNRPGVGLVLPSQFISIAEETGLIADLGKWVLREACRTAAEWNEGDAALHKVAVNLSARQFQSRDLTQMVGQILDETGCRPEWLELEITESLLLEEDDSILTALSEFKSMGLSIAIDDFGTGYSALSYLARFPIDTLKIDRSFVQKVTTDQRHAELVKAILLIAHCLGQQVVAEGVETVDQAAFLQLNGCQVEQGFLFSKPLPKPDMTLMPRYLELDGVFLRSGIVSESGGGSASRSPLES